LIQAELETIIADESCDSLDEGEDYYLTGDGEYFQDIPSFASPKSDVFDEYTKYHGKDDFVRIWGQEGVPADRDQLRAR